MKLPWAILFHALFLQLAAYVIRPTAAYKALELGVEPAYLGLIAASFAVVPLFIAVFIGRAADSGLENRLMAFGAVLMVSAGVGLLLRSDSLLMLLLWNVLLGLGHLMSVLGEQSRVAQVAGSRMDAAFGMYTFAGSIGQAIGPSLIGLFGGANEIPDTTQLFGAYIVATLVMTAITVWIVFSGRRLRPVGLAPKAMSIRHALDAPPAVRRQLIGAMAISMMVLAAIDLIAVYLPALGVERGIPAGIIGLLLTLRAVATMVSRLGLGRLVARFGRQELIFGSTAIAAVALGLLVAPLDVSVMAIVLVVAGVALGIGQPLSMTTISLAAPAGTRATWLALRLSGNRLGQSAVPVVVGLVAASAGVAGVFGAMAALLGITAAVSWRTLRRGE